MERLHDSGYDDESSSSHDLLADDGSTPSGDVIISSCKELKISTPCERLSVDDDVREMLLQRCAASPSSSLTSSFSSLSSLPSVHRHDVGSWRLMTKGGLQIKGANLLWHWNDHKHIWDVEFMEDGNLVIIAGQNVKIEGKVVSIKRKRFHCLGLDGRILEVPFPGKYHDPGGISMCKETGALAITDTMRGANAADVTILRNCDNKWMFKSHKTEQAAFRVALTESDTAICAVRWEKLVKYKDTTPVWSRSISTSNDLVPYINMDRCGRIIVSTPAANRISVYSHDGQLLAVFPSWFIRTPAGVCVDSTGRVLVADKSTGRIAQFTSQGHFVQTLVWTKHQPTCIDLYNDKYLAVGTHFNGLYLYELEWQ